MEGNNRIDLADGLRGFALLGILYIHVIQYFLGNSPNQEINNTALQTSFDHWLGASSYWFSLSKFFSIFSMLFGLSFYIQMRNSRAKAPNFRWRFFWKLVLLFGFGFVHRLFFLGDILLIYALVGMLLIPLSQLNNTTLMTIALLLLAGLGRVVYFAFYGGGQIFPVDYAAHYNGYIETVLRGDLNDVARSNLSSYTIFWNEQLGHWGRFYSTLGYFILGLLIGRSGILEDISTNTKRIKQVFFLSVVVALVTLVLHLKYIGGAWEIFRLPHNTWDSVARYALYDCFSIAATFVYATGFILMASIFSTAPWFRYLCSYGRTGLTSYIGQSLLGTFIFFNWGLGMIHEFNLTLCFLMFFLMAFIQISFSNLWLRLFNYGPLEWVWRSLTHMKWFENWKLGETKT